jgi:hypothetical protein
VGERNPDEFNAAEPDPDETRVKAPRISK